MNMTPFSYHSTTFVAGASFMLAYLLVGASENTAFVTTTWPLEQRSVTSPCKQDGSNKAFFDAINNGNYDENYDAIIVGSGMGSLVAGNVLAGAGRRVLMLESHSIPGGFTTNFYRKGYRFEVSTHMITGCDRGGTVGDLLHDLHVDDRIEFIQLKELMRWIDPAHDIDYVVPLSLSQHICQLSQLFPNQEQGIKEFYRLYYPVVEFVLNFKRKQGLDKIVYSLSNVPALLRLLMLKGKTASDILVPLVTDPACRDIMTIMTLIFGLDYTEIDAPIFLFGSMGHHADGGEYCSTIEWAS